MSYSSTYIKPRRLSPGDTVAIVSPSWGGPSLFPATFDLGLINLTERLGLRVTEFPTARMDAGELWRSPEVRAHDINRAFEDPEVNAIIASIGGDDSVRILPFLDLNLIHRNPKVLMGYSDATTVLAYLNWRLGLVTYHGPSVMAGLAQMRYLPEAFERHLRAVLMEPETPVRYEPYAHWCDGYADWSTPGYSGETNPLLPNTEKWKWLQGHGRVEGRLFGGCIEVLECMKGTRFWPDPGFWHGKILFLETSEDKPAVGDVKLMLRNYGMQGILDRVSGLLMGRAAQYSDREKAGLYDGIIDVISGEFGRKDLPVVANMDFGHTDPQLMLPLEA